MDNREIAEVFEDISRLLEAKGDSSFKVRAYRNAARAIAHHPVELRQLVAEGADLRRIPGIGEAIALKARELVSTGRLEYYERLKSEMPAGILDLMALPGVGPRTAVRLSSDLGLKSVAELEQALESGRLSGVSGLGEKTAETLLRTIRSRRTRDIRIPITDVLPVIEEIRDRMCRSPGVFRLEVAGSVRRFRDTVGDVDILATSEQPGDTIDRFVQLDLAREVLAKGETKATVLTDTGLQVDLRIVPPEQFGSLLQYFTGSREHNIALREHARRLGLSLSEYGIADVESGEVVTYADEESFYARLGMQFIPPEMRENQGEIQLALRDALPRTITVDDIRGDLHVHTDWSDGKASVYEMAAAARDRGYEYIAITDHSIGLGMMSGMDGEKLRRQRNEIEDAMARLPGFRILRGVEANIRSDGSIDLPDEDLAELEIVVAGVHGTMNQSESRMTERVICALRNRHVDVLAHPSGRLLGRREPVQMDIAAVIRAARDSGTMLEINAMPDRLDLKDTAVAAAREANVLMTIGTDAHAIHHLDHVDYGVRLARRAWCGKQHIANTLSASSLLDRLDREPASRGG
ncbi:MAG: DNA polymerase/3'-5' exonuclease PolX [Chloroflexota bacterium]